MLNAAAKRAAGLLRGIPTLTLDSQSAMQVAVRPWPSSATESVPFLGSLSRARSAGPGYSFHALEALTEYLVFVKAPLEYAHVVLVDRLFSHTGVIEGADIEAAFLVDAPAE